MLIPMSNMAEPDIISLSTSTIENDTHLTGMMQSSARPGLAKTLASHFGFLVQENLNLPRESLHCAIHCLDFLFA